MVAKPFIGSMGRSLQIEIDQMKKDKLIDKYEFASRYDRKDGISIYKSIHIHVLEITKIEEDKNYLYLKDKNGNVYHTFVKIVPGINVGDICVSLGGTYKYYGKTCYSAPKGYYIIKADKVNEDIKLSEFKEQKEYTLNKLTSMGFNEYIYDDTEENKLTNNRLLIRNLVNNIDQSIILDKFYIIDDLLVQIIDSNLTEGTTKYKKANLNKNFQSDDSRAAKFYILASNKEGTKRSIFRTETPLKDFDYITIAYENKAKKQILEVCPWATNFKYMKAKQSRNYLGEWISIPKINKTFKKVFLEIRSKDNQEFVDKNVCYIIHGKDTIRLDLQEFKEIKNNG